jgi:hypothetical protein
MRQRFRRRAARITATIAGAAAAFALAAGGLKAQNSQDYVPQATIVEVMDSMVMPLAQVLWDAVIYEDTVKGPESDEGWQKVRWAAVSLAEAANVLMIPGRPVAAPDAVAGEGELSPKEIQDLIAKTRGAWVGHARAMHEVAMQAIEAVDAKNAEQLSDVGGTLDSVCEGCHLQFWYPNQR